MGDTPEKPPAFCAMNYSHNELVLEAYEILGDFAGNQSGIVKRSKTSNARIGRKVAISMAQKFSKIEIP